jgi:hypothetical protein
MARDAFFADDDYQPSRTVLAAVLRDLDRLPEELRESTAAMAAQELAKSIDLGPETYRFQASLVRELRETMDSLTAKAPPKVEGDAVDDLNARRAARRSAASAG